MNILYLGNLDDNNVLKYLQNNFNTISLDGLIKVDDIKNIDWIISYGYKFILKSDIIDSTLNPILNLHISYLPYNKGAYPNYWSFVNKTPKGVSIHKIEEGIDTGPIFIQKRVSYSENDTLYSFYKKLKFEIEKLFIENFKKIIDGEIRPFTQKGKGSFHKKSELPENIDWNINVNKL